MCLLYEYWPVKVEFCEAVYPPDFVSSFSKQVALLVLIKVTEMADFFDWFRVVALVLGFGYVARQNRKTWMWAESVMFGVYGAALFLCPSFLVKI